MTACLRRFVRLPVATRRLLAEAALALVLLKLLLGSAGLQRALWWSTRLPHCRNQTASAKQLSEAVVRVSRHFPGRTTCLTRALALHMLLRRYRHAARLRLGVQRSPDGAFGAHAWIEHEGQVLIGHAPTTARYKPLTCNFQR